MLHVREQYTLSPTLKHNMFPIFIIIAIFQLPCSSKLVRFSNMERKDCGEMNQILCTWNGATLQVTKRSSEPEPSSCGGISSLPHFCPILPYFYHAKLGTRVQNYVWMIKPCVFMLAFCSHRPTKCIRVLISVTSIYT